MTPNSSSRWLIAVIATAMLILLTGGIWFYRTQQHELQQHAEDELQAVAQLKVDQIVAWRAERMGDAALLTESPILVEAVTRWMTNPQADSTEDLLAQFRVLEKHYNYYDVMLVDVEGTERLNLRGNLGTLHADAAQYLAAALHDRQPVLTDLHSGPGDLPPHIGAIAPLFASSEPSAEPIGAIILQSDASQFLYPMIQSWPTPSNSAETLLVRQDGDAVLFLNELRHQKGTALTLRIPLDQIDLPAAKAAQGYQGITQGKDYRGVEVMSAVQAIPDSPWFIVAKVDRSEVLADWQLYSRLIAALVLGALIVVGTTGGMVWQRNQTIHYLALLQAQQARQESETRYQTTLLSIGDGVIVTDAEGQVVLLNPVAEVLTGWSEHEARGKPLEDVFCIINEDTRQPVENPARRVMREGVIVGLANHTLLITKDGQEIPIADSGAPTYDADGSLSGVVLVFRDQTEERAAQKALQDSEAYVRTILDNLPVGVAVNSADPTVTFSYMNDNFVRYYRTTREALADPDAFWEAVYEDVTFRETLRTRVLEDIASGDPERMHWEDIPITRQGAETTFISARNTPIYGQQLMLSTVWDTTERKLAEAALRESEERFRRAIADAPFPMLIHAENGEIVVVNQTWTDITGYTHADIPTIDAWTERAYGERKAIVQEDIDRLYSMQERQAEGEYVITTRCGEKRTWDFSSSPLGQLSDGRRLVLSMAMDVTERKQAEMTLQQALSTVKSIVDVSPIAIIHLDPDGIVQSWNAAAEKMFGWSAHEVIGRILPYVPPDKMKEFENFRARVMQGQGFYGIEAQRLRKDETEITVSISTAPMRDIEDNLIGIMAVVDDITARKAADEEIRRLNAELEQRVTQRTAQLEAANQELEAFAYSVSHDLRAPLRAIDGFSKIIEEDYGKILDAEGTRLLNVVRSNAQKMDQLITELLTLSRVTRSEMKVARIDMTTMAQSIYHEIASPEIQSLFSFSVSALPDAHADTTLMRQVWSNLIGNAIKYTMPKDTRQIEISGWRDSDENVYSIKDTGVGFNPDYKHKLFGVFQRLHKTEEFDGTGVGLAIVQRIVYQHGGRVWADSQIGEGATFYFSLLRRAEDE